MRGRGAEAEREQNPLRKKWVQHSICRVRFETARSKPSLSSRNGRSACVRSASAPRPRGSGAGMSKSARLHSATAPRMCERSLNGNKCRYKSRRNPPPLIEHLAPVSLWAKTEWSYVHTCAGRLRSGGGWILTFPLRYRGYVHTYAERTRSGAAISWGQWWFGARGFEADAANWVLDPFLAERILLPLRLLSATAHVWTHVMICVEANFPSASARVRTRMCERTFRTCWSPGTPFKQRLSKPTSGHWGFL